MSVADVDSAALTTTLTVTNGTLNVATGGGATIGGNGTGSVTIGGTATQINSALAGLSYLGNLDFNGADTLTVTTSDGLLGDTDTVAITVNAVNDPPVNTVPGPQIANEDTALLIAGLSVADTDSPLLVTTLAVAHGTLTATGTGVSGSGTATLTIAGTGTELNAALSTLSYRGNLNFNGADTLTVTTSDGALSDTDTVPITVNAVNDPPREHRAGRAERQRGHDPVDRRRVGRGRGQPDANHHADGDQRHAQRDRRRRRNDRRQRHRSPSRCRAPGRRSTLRSQVSPITAILNFNGPDTLTVTTSDGADYRHRRRSDHGQRGERRAGEHRAGRAERRTRTPRWRSLACRWPMSTTRLLTTILSVTSGILTVGAGGVVSNNGTGTVTIIGTAAQINAALATLSYRGNLNFNGADTLTVTTSDGRSSTPTRSRSRSTRSTIGRCSISTPTIRAARPGWTIRQLSPRAAPRLRSPTSTI